MDLDDAIVTFNGTVFYDKFSVAMMGSLIDSGQFEIDGWTFESGETGNSASYFYNLVCILEKKKPERSEVLYEGFIKIEGEDL
jgi:hypothetical protein